jgi:S-adenosylmethionine:tRNA ribosyltransferase-isomerase
MLAAIAGEETIERSYLAAVEHGCLWQEFGDLQLILP